MDFSSMVNKALNMLWWVIPVVIILSLFKTSWFKGVMGEAIVRLVAMLRLPAATYHGVHNVTLPTLDGTTQIDHIFVSRFGIFVVETKHMRGLIFGAEHQAQWTQQIFNTAFQFQNPLRQNYKHVKTLESVLKVSAQTVHSVIVFTGKSTFKSPMPTCIRRWFNYTAYIKSFRKAVFSETEVQTILARIQSGRLPPTWATNRRHVKQLKARINSKAQKKCPKCGSVMVIRTAKRGAHMGSQFWGCSAYPACKVVQGACEDGMPRR